MSGGACAVVGAQFGSEGKGAIVGHIAREYNHHVRVGAANAGHTVYVPATYAEGGEIEPFQKHVMQQLPCAAYANPDAELYVGPGALISPSIFDAELEKLRLWRAERGLPPKKVFVDLRAHVITDAQIVSEAATDLEERIGSTSATAREGIGVAQAERVLRSAGCVLAHDAYAHHDSVELCSVPRKLWDTRVQPTYQAKDRKILLEGTQGTGLSLTTGPFPWVTSRNTTVAGLCADAGLAPSRVDRVIVVARTYPIRVAGNSGPFYADSDEISWESIGVDPDSERTTVTKKVRRVATFSLDQVQEACAINGATEIALTFADYLDTALAGRTNYDSLARAVDVTRFISAIEKYCGVPVRYVGTGPHSIIDLHPKGEK